MNTSQKSNPYFTLRKKTQQPSVKAAESAEQESKHPLDDEQKLFEILEHLSHQQDELTIKNLYPSETPTPLTEAPAQTMWFEPHETESPTDSTSGRTELEADPMGVSEQEMIEILDHLSQQADTLEVTSPESSTSSGSGVEPTSQIEWFSSSTQEHTSHLSAPNFAESSTDSLEVSDQDVIGALHQLADQTEELTEDLIVNELSYLEDSQERPTLGDTPQFENTSASDVQDSPSGSLFSGNLLARLGLTSLAVTGGGVGVWLAASMLSPSANDPELEKTAVGRSELDSNESPEITATVAAPALDSLEPQFNSPAIQSPNAPSKAPTPVAPQLEPDAAATSPQASGANQLATAPEKTPDPHTAVSNLVQEKPLTAEDLKGLSDWDLTLLRNEIYARHGRHFLEPELQQYFEAQSWYQPRHVPGKFPVSRLSSLEIRNAIFIREYQNTHEKFYRW
ncbi:MAG: YARHG domain-containing protein [Leptolyngbyaceae cyanobacterium MO_188.B28]|nr:YARHG domain-containing protein [Leptolyngbyaceae cyanobacterium MO_188.B28]